MGHIQCGSRADAPKPKRGSRVDGPTPTTNLGSRTRGKSSLGLKVDGSNLVISGVVSRYGKVGTMQNGSFSKADDLERDSIYGLEIN
ncbi:hypothetical protein Tco_0690099 [Tanacetum coccineum]